MVAAAPTVAVVVVATAAVIAKSTYSKSVAWGPNCFAQNGPQLFCSAVADRLESILLRQVSHQHMMRRRLALLFECARANAS